jgi:hypothetical protein
MNIRASIPRDLGIFRDDGQITNFAPAPDVREWIEAEILSEDGRLYNEDHKHLVEADFAVLWASAGFDKQGRHVIGQCEQVGFRVGGWQKQRQEEQMMHWFGHIPTFLITLSAFHCWDGSEADFCALVEHELYHIGHQHMGETPQFTKDGQPKLFLKGHDVEEFVGVVRRYGVKPDSSVAQMIDAAKKKPEVGALNISHACGTCLLKAA